MAVDSVITSSATGFDGNSYTTSVSNDTLTNEDFLTLMLEEMKQQDPTDPTDSASIMDSQMQMSTIQANQDMSTALTSLQASYANSAISTAANMIGYSVKTGEVDELGDDKIFKVVTVDNKDGDLYLTVKQFVGVVDGLQNSEGEIAKYDANGIIYDGTTATDYRVSLDSDGRFEYNEDGTVMLLDENNDVITDTTVTEEYTYGGYSLMYSDETSEIPLSSITAVS